MSQKQYSTRLPEDRAEELERYCEERNISKAEALRRSVEELYTEPESDPELYWKIAMGTGILYLMLVQSGILSLSGTVLGAVPVLGALLFWASKVRVQN